MKKLIISAYRKLRTRLLNVEFLIPGSPNDAFCSQIAFFSLALKKLGPPYNSARVVFCCGNEFPKKIYQRWANYLASVEIRQVSQSEAENDSIFAQIDARFDAVSTDADISIFCDADILVVRRLDNLLLKIVDQNRIAGSIAHFPVPYRRDISTSEAWAQLFHEMRVRPNDQWFRHTLTGSGAVLSDSICPFYVNFGFVMAPPRIWKTLKSDACEIRRKLMSILDAPYFSAQVALTLAIYKNDISVESLPLRYNYPNDEAADLLWPQERQYATVYHYLRDASFDRAKIFCTKSDFLKFITSSMSGSNLDFQRYIYKITKGNYPF